MRVVEMAVPGPAGASAALILCVSLSADADEPVKKAEAPQANAEAKPVADEAKHEAETVGKFQPPPGFRAKKRGDTIVWCRKEPPLGSRFPELKCYDEAQLRELASRPQWSESAKACGKGGCSTN